MEPQMSRSFKKKQKTFASAPFLQKLASGDFSGPKKLF
jgi:hypothetical protein